MSDNHPTDPAPPPPAEPFNLEAALTALLARVNLIADEQLAQHETARQHGEALKDMRDDLRALAKRLALVERDESTNGAGYSGVACIEQKEGHHG